MTKYIRHLSADRPTLFRIVFRIQRYYIIIITFKFNLTITVTYLPHGKEHSTPEQLPRLLILII